VSTLLGLGPWDYFRDRRLRCPYYWRAHDQRCMLEEEHPGWCEYPRGSGPFQHYWKCEHFPSALDNFQNDRPQCGICTEPPAWWSNGENLKPKSWA
jgi:hypothetical protein